VNRFLSPTDPAAVYRGRLAPSPTGLLHLGHARTFWTAARRAADHGGQLIFRNEDLDSQRCRADFEQAMMEDLRWLGIKWDEGPDCGGPAGPYAQSERRGFYLRTWEALRERRMIYPCTCSRKDVAQAAGAPNDSDDEPLYPGRCRPEASGAAFSTCAVEHAEPAGVNWRFRVPDGEEICFNDLHMGEQSMIAGKDFGDFIVRRRDDVPAYQLAVVVDDARSGFAEVHRTADSLVSGSGTAGPPVLSLRLDSRRRGCAAGEAARCIEYSQAARDGMDCGAGESGKEFPDVMFVRGSHSSAAATARRSFTPNDRVLRPIPT
jgi:glutamyl/glutaminyl-tRNA synthetase